MYVTIEEDGPPRTSVLIGAGEMARCLRVFAAFLEDLSSKSSTCFKQLTGRKEGRKDEKKRKSHGVHLHWLTALGHGPALEGGCYTCIRSDTPFEKTNFPSPSRDQLQTASWLSVGF